MTTPTFDVVIEVTKGSKTKYEWDAKLGRMRLDRILTSPTRYPLDYGFILDTLGEDGEPLDAMVVLYEPAPINTVIRCRALGILNARGKDNKILAVPTADVTNEWNNITDVPNHIQKELSDFFQMYLGIEHNRGINPITWGDAATAEAEVQLGQERVPH